MKHKTMHTGIIPILMLCVFFAGCSAGARSRVYEETAVPYSESKENVLPTMVERTQPAYGSLWRQNQSSLFAANKATGIGDILTVAIYEQASAKKEAETSADRSSSALLGIPNFFGIETSIVDSNPDLDPSKLISASSETEFTGTGSTSRKEYLTATLTTQVVEVFENGNMRIQGGKTVRVNDEDQIIRLSGIVRPVDISINNVIDSKYILDAKIEYTGKGVISEKQRPGWLVRLIDTVWPF